MQLRHDASKCRQHCRTGISGQRTEVQRARIAKHSDVTSSANFWHRILSCEDLLAAARQLGDGAILGHRARIAERAPARVRQAKMSDAPTAQCSGATVGLPVPPGLRGARCAEGVEQRRLQVRGLPCGHVGAGMQPYACTGTSREATRCGFSFWVA